MEENKTKEDEAVALQKSLNEWEEEDLSVKSSMVSRLYKIFTSPGDVFFDVSKKAGAFIPILLVILVMVGTSYLTKDIYLNYSLDQVKLMSPEQAAMLAELPADQLEGAKAGMILSYMVVTPVIVLLAIFIKALFVNLICMPLGGQGNYKSSLGVVAWAYMVAALGVILRSVAVIMTGNFGISFSPAILMTLDPSNMAVYTLLSNFDLFNIWYLALSILGVSIVHKISKGKAAIAVLVPALLVIAFQVGSVLFTTASAGM